jgi:hypothetical protein
MTCCLEGLAKGLSYLGEASPASFLSANCLIRGTALYFYVTSQKSVFEDPGRTISGWLAISAFRLESIFNQKSAIHSF